MTGQQRSREARARAETALAALLDATGEHWREIIVIGGLVPDVIAPGPVAHQGTADVDVMLDLALVFDRDEQDFGWLEQALTAAEFVAASDGVSWRWVRETDGFPVVLDLIVDVPDSRAQPMALPGSTGISALNVVGPAAAIVAPQTAHAAGREALFAGLGGYLVAKAAAVVDRGKPKDLYDFAHVVVNAERAGPGRAAQEAAASADPRYDYDPADLMRRACEHFTQPDSTGAVTYAAESIRAGAEDDEETLARDAVAAVAAFSAAFEPAMGNRRDP